MFDMRLRLPELMNRKDSDIRTAYQLAERAGLSMTNAYHMVKKQGRVARIDLATLEALCTAFRVAPNDLLERDAEASTRAPSGKPAVKPRRR